MGTVMARLHREYSVGCSYRGFSLTAYDYPLGRWALATLVEWLFGLLGHPCCGRGLGRIWPIGTVSYRLLSAALNLLTGAGASVLEIALTAVQALALHPRYAEDTGPGGWITLDGEDEDGDVWVDGALVAVRCDKCDQVVAAGRGSAHVVKKAHAEGCAGQLA
jgi:hypothetical protein